VANQQHDSICLIQQVLFPFAVSKGWEVARLFDLIEFSDLQPSFSDLTKHVLSRKTDGKPEVGIWAKLQWQESN